MRTLAELQAMGRKMRREGYSTPASRVTPDPECPECRGPMARQGGTAYEFDAHCPECDTTWHWAQGWSSLD